MGVDKHPETSLEPGREPGRGSKRLGAGRRPEDHSAHPAPRAKKQLGATGPQSSAAKPTPNGAVGKAGSGSAGANPNAAKPERKKPAALAGPAAGAATRLGVGGTSLKKIATDPDTRKKAAVGAGAAAAPASVPAVTLLALLNWLKSVFFSTMAFALNGLLALVLAVVKVATVVVGYVMGVGSAISGFLGGAISAPVAAIAVSLSLVAGVGGLVGSVIHNETSQREGALVTERKCVEAPPVAVPVGTTPGSGGTPSPGSGTTGTPSPGLGVIPTQFKVTPGSASLDSPLDVAVGNFKTGTKGVSVFSSKKPDVMLLNEVGSESLPRLKAAAPGYDAYRDPNPEPNPDRNDGERWKDNVVMWRADTWQMVDGGRVKIVEGDHVVMPGGKVVWGRWATWVILRRISDGALISAIAVHHMTTVEKRWGPAEPTKQQRYAQGMDYLVQLAHALEAFGPVVVGGDFNSFTSSGAWSAIPKMEGAGYSLTKGQAAVIFLFSQLKRTALQNFSAGQVGSDHPAFISTLKPRTGAVPAPGSTQTTPPSGTTGTPTTGTAPGTAGSTGASACCMTSSWFADVSAALADVAATSRMSESNAKVVFTALSSMGMSAQNIAGILGNWSQESGVDPTSMQGVYDEPYRMGARKQALEAGGFTILGIGLGQWSGGRNVALREYARAKGKPWYELSTQLAFMVSADSGAPIVRDMIGHPKASAGEAAVFFHDEWERSADTAVGIAERAASAEQWLVKMASWTPGSTIPGSITGSVTSALDTALSGGLAESCAGTNVSFAGLTSGGLDKTQAQALIDLYLEEGDAFLDKRYGDQGGPGSCGSDHAMNCVSFSAYFLNKYTSLTQGYPRGDGRQTAYSLATMTNRQVSPTPTVYSVFSKGGGANGHTGVVLGIEASDTLIIGEAHWCAGRGNIREVPASTWQAEGWVFTDVSDLVTGTSLPAAA